MVFLFPVILAGLTDCTPLAGVPDCAYAVVVFSVGLALFLPSHWAVYRSTQWPRETRIAFLAAEPSNLVTSGIHRSLRSPQIGGIDLMLLGEVVFFWSGLLLLYCALVCIASALVAVHVEEAQLQKRFGSAYVKYKADVKRFIPWLL